MPTQRSRPTRSEPVTVVDAVVRGRELTTRALHRSSAGCSRSGSATRPSRCWRPAARSRSRPRSATASTCASASATKASRPAGPIAFGFGARADSLRRPLPFDVVFRLEENHWNGTVAPQLVVRDVWETDPRYEQLRAELAGQWRAGEDAWTEQAREVFDELGLEPGGTASRNLLESERFRELLAAAEPAALAEAA